MGGFSSVTGLETVMNADNCSFDGTKRGGVITADGQLFIGNSVSPRIRPGSLTSPNGTLTIGYSAPDITLDVDGGSVGQTITGNSGGALSPTLGNWNILGTATNGIQSAGAGSTLTVRMQSPYADADFSFESQVGATVRTLTVQNTVDAASSAAILDIQVAGTSSEFALWRVGVGGTGSFAGYTVPAGDSFQLIYEDADDVTPSSATNIPWRIDSINVGTGQSRMLVRSDLTVAAQGTGQTYLGLNTGNAAGVDSLLQMIQTNGTDDIRVHFAGGSGANWNLGTDGGLASDLFITQASVTSWPPSASNTLMQFYKTGEIVKPLQPAFQATTNAGIPQSNVTGAGTVYTVLFNAERFNINNDYASPTFTAPVTGKYLMEACVRVNGVTSSATVIRLNLITSNKVYQVIELDAGNLFVGADSGITINGSMYVDMDAADTASVQVQVDGMAGDTVSIAVVSTANQSFAMTLVN